MLPQAALLALALATTTTGSGRDPFESPGHTDEGQKPALERYALAAIVVQGVVAGTASPRALVALPDGSTHLVRVGSALGPHLGRIVKIHRGGVVVREAYFDFNGKHFEETTTLALKTGE